MTALYTALCEGYSKEALACMVCDLRAEIDRLRAELVVKRLRAIAGCTVDMNAHVDIHLAADEIEKLRAELVEERRNKPTAQVQAAMEGRLGTHKEITDV